MNSTTTNGKAVLELVFGGRHVASATAPADRPYLLLEDLVDDPVELRLSDFASLDSDDGISSALH